LKSKDLFQASVKYTEDDDDKVKVEWFVFPESTSQNAGGDFENAMQPELGVLKKKNDYSVEVIAPKEEGAYRLFVFVRDKGNRTAYANIPFYVLPRSKEDPVVKKVTFKQQLLEDESISE
jgi:hypothetical protein